MVDPIPIETDDQGTTEDIVVSTEDIRAQILAQQETTRAMKSVAAAMGRLAAAMRTKGYK